MPRHFPLTITIAGLALAGVSCVDDGTSKVSGRSDEPVTNSAVATSTATPAPGTVPTAVDPAADTPPMVGWVTFAVEHMMFGAVLGGLAQLARSRGDASVAVRSAKLSR